MEWVSRSWAEGQGSFCGPAELRVCRCVSAGERCYETQGDGLGRHLTRMRLPTTDRERNAFKSEKDNTRKNFSRQTKRKMQ